MSLPGRHEFRALGTGCVVATLDPAALPDAAAVVEAELARVDRACSRFRDDSDLVRVNRAAGAAVVVDPILIDAVDAALRAAMLTDGDLDPTIGSSMIALGYDCDFSRLDLDASTVVRVRRVPGWQCISMRRDHSELQVPDGVELDLGATAKAWAADRSAAAAAARTGTGAPSIGSVRNRPVSSPSVRPLRVARVSTA